MATPHQLKFSKVENELEVLEQLLDDIKSELNHYGDIDWDDLSEEEQQQVVPDLGKIERHLRQTAKLFSRLTGVSTPHWGLR